MQDICPNPLCHWCGERGHKQAECSRRRKRRASSEGEGSGNVAAGGAPSAAKTGSVVLTSGTPGRESVRAVTSSRGPGSSGNGWSTGSSSNGRSYAGAVAGRPTKPDTVTREQPLTSQVTDIFSRISRVSGDQGRLDERLVELDKQQELAKLRYEQVLASIEAEREAIRVERAKQAALEEPLRLLRDALQAYSKVAGTNTPVPMQADTGVITSTPEVRSGAPKPDVSTMDTSEQGAHSEVKVEDEVDVNWYEHVVAVEQALQGQAPGSQTQMPGETNPQSPDPPTGSEGDDRQIDTEDAPTEQTAVSAAARTQQVIARVNTWDTDESDDL